MMVARHLVNLGPAEDPGQPAAGRDPHRMRSVDAGHRRMPAVAHQVWQVLVQAAAHGHVDHLHAAADAEHRQPARQGGG